MPQTPEDDDVVIIEEDLAELEDPSQEEKKVSPEELAKQEEEQTKKKILLFGGIAIGFALLVTISLLLYLKFSHSKKETTPNTLALIEKKLDENKIPPIKPSQLETMIAKANYLYTNGSKKDALLLYEKIAIHSEAISQYNLGVAQLKNKQYKLAMQSFENAINNNEKRCVSAINAAVCALHLKNQKSFEYYIDLAYAYLPYELKSPLYSYYYTLIHYYKNNYLEALSSLVHKTSTEYPAVQKHLQAKIEALYGNNYDAIDTLMQGQLEENDDFNIGLLYGRVGDYDLAIHHFNKAILKNIEPLRSRLALTLIELKAGKITQSAKDLEDVTKRFPQKVYKTYPLDVRLRKSLFNPMLAQKNFRENIIVSKDIDFQEIFYFAPYKVFNANNTISYIRKGNANVFIDDVQTAQQYLKKSVFASNVNLGIAKAIKKALDFKIREANNDLKKLLKLQPKHPILHYNLGLTYAQMGDMVDAYHHFIRSYHLDAKNYTSGIFAVITAKFIHKKTLKLVESIKDALENETSSPEIELYKTLLYVANNNYVETIDWLEQSSKKERPLALILKTLIAKKLKRFDMAEKIAQKLVFLVPNDILPHILYFDIKNRRLNRSDYAKELVRYLKAQKFHYQDLYYGPFITRYLYVQVNTITGQLFYLREQLKNVLETTKTDNRDIVSTLALASFYDKAFEESYTLYNSAIDNFKMRDAYTLFMGALASIGAKHHANAIALLELSKMKNKNFYEVRYALGLLYMEMKNNDGAIIQFSQITKNGFHSKYFNFDIDTNKLLFYHSTLSQ